MIQFIFDESKEKHKLVFSMVKENQFFVDDDNRLCQKLHEDEFNVITDCNGQPFCDTETADEDMEISRIISYVKRITF